jgi:hypothetical protein
VAEKDFYVSLPQEVVGGFGWNEAEVPSRVRETLVMDLLRLDGLSEAQAAAISGRRALGASRTDGTIRRTGDSNERRGTRSRARHRGQA